MNFLRIEQTFGKIGVETQRSQVQLQSKLPKLQMHQTQAKIEIDKQEPRVIIDQHECFATAGLKNPFELTAEAAQNAQQQAAEYTVKKAQEGDMLADIRGKGNTIAAIARSNTFEEHEFNIDNIPKARPKIEIEGHINFSAEKAQINTQVEAGDVNVNFTEPKTNIYVRQKPSINIQYVGSNIDVYA